MNIELLESASHSETKLNVALIENPLEPHKVVRYEASIEAETRLIDLLPEELGPMIVSINGSVLSDEALIFAVVSPGDHMILCPILQGGGNKGLLRIVALIAVSALAIATAGAGIPALGIVGGGFAAGAAAGAISIVGGLVINALLPVAPGTGGLGEDPGSFGVDAAKSTSRAGIRIPVIYGRARIGPNRIGIYTEQLTGGSNQELYMLFALCEGEITGILPETIEIGEQPIGQFESGEVEIGTVLNGANTQALPTFFEDRTVTPYNVSQTLIQNNTISFTTEGNIDKFRVDLIAQSLFNLSSKGAKETTRVEFEVKYQDVTNSGPLITLTSADASVNVLSNGISAKIGTAFDPSPLEGTRRALNLTTSSATATANAGKTFKPHYVQVVYNSLDTYSRSYLGGSTNLTNTVYKLTGQTTFPTVFQDYSAANNLDLYESGMFVIIDESQTQTGSGQFLTAVGIGGTQPPTFAKTGKWVYVQGASSWTAKKIVGSMIAEYVSKVGGNIAIEGATSNAVRASFESPTLPNSRYRIDVKRLTTPTTNGTDEVIFSAVNQILLSGVSYPNTALMPMRFKITERFGSIPNISVVVDGRKVQVRKKKAAATLQTTTQSNSVLWGGSDRVDAAPVGTGSTYYEWVYQTSANPAWVTYDILTDARIGAKIPAGKIDIDRWQEWADYCDLKGLEFNAVLENDSNLWDTLQSVFRAGHAQILPVGSRYSVAIERADDPVMLFSVANIKKGSFQINYLPRSNRIDEVSMSYFDRDDGWKPKDVTVRDPDTDPNAAPRIQNFQAYWVSSKEQAVKDGNLKINLSKGMTHTIQFESPVEAIGCTVGDQILIQHDMPRWSQGGRLDAGSTTTVLQLDRPASMTVGSTYQVMLQYDTLVRVTTTVFAVMSTNQANDTVTFTAGTPDGPIRRAVIAGVEYAVSRVITVGGRYGLVLGDPVPSNSAGVSLVTYDVDASVTRTVTTVPGDQMTITCTTALPLAPATYVKWVFGKTDTIRRPYRISGITAGSTSYERTITAYEYKSSYYNLDAIIETPQPRLLAELGHVRNLFATQDNVVVDNVYIAEVVLSWLAPETVGYVGADVFVSVANEQFYLYEEVRNGRLNTRVKGMPPGSKVAFKIVAVDGIGRRAVGEPPILIYLVESDKIAPGIPTSVAAASQLRSVGFSWVKPTDSDFKSVLLFSGASYATSTQVAESSGTTLIYYPPDDTVRTYWLVSTDYNGNKSAPHLAGGVSIASRQLAETDIGSGFVDAAIVPYIPPSYDIVVMPSVGDVLQLQTNATSTRAVYPTGQIATLREDPVGAFGTGCYSIEKAGSNLLAPNTVLSAWTVSTGTIAAAYADWLTLNGTVTRVTGLTLTGNQPYAFSVDAMNETTIAKTITLTGLGTNTTFSIAPGQYRRVFITNTKASYVAGDSTMTIATNGALLVRRPQVELNAYSSSYMATTRADQYIDYAGFGGRFNYARLSFLGWIMPLRAAAGTQVYLADSTSFTLRRNASGFLEILYGAVTVTSNLTPLVNSFNLIGFAAGNAEDSLSIFLNDQIFTTTIGAGFPVTAGTLTVGNLGSSRSTNVSECRLNSFAIFSDTLITASRAKKIYQLRAPFIDPASKVIAPRPTTVSLSFV